MEILSKGTEVLLPLKEEGKIVKYVDRLWSSYYDVKITKGGIFNQVDDVVDFLVRDVIVKI